MSPRQRGKAVCIRSGAGGKQRQSTHLAAGYQVLPPHKRRVDEGFPFVILRTLRRPASFCRPPEMPTASKARPFQREVKEAERSGRRICPCSKGGGVRMGTIVGQIVRSSSSNSSASNRRPGIVEMSLTKHAQIAEKGIGNGVLRLNRTVHARSFELVRQPPQRSQISCDIECEIERQATHCGCSPAHSYSLRPFP